MMVIIFVWAVLMLAGMAIVMVDRVYQRAAPGNGVSAWWALERGMTIRARIVLLFLTYPAIVLWMITNYVLTGMDVFGQWTVDLAGLTKEDRS